MCGGKGKKGWRKENWGFRRGEESFAGVNGWMVALYIKKIKTPKDDFFSHYEKKSYYTLLFEFLTTSFLSLVL